MSTLAGLQQQFMRYLHGEPNGFVDTLAAADGLAPAARAHIYLNAYRVRLLDTLKDSFDKTWAWLGDEAFEQAGLRYIEAHPPTQFSLRPFGDGFADALRDAWPADPEVAELARLDWALRDAFDGADAQPLEAAALATLSEEDWATVVFRLHPTAQMLRMQRNTLDLWHAMDRGDTPPAVVDLAQPVTVLVWRKGVQPHFRSVDAAEAGMLAAMQSGMPFAAACETVESDDAQALIGSWLARWLEDGLLCADRR